jgi:hypothetical protein
MYREKPAAGRVITGCDTHSTVLARSSRMALEIPWHSPFALWWEVSQWSCAHPKSGVHVLLLE